MIVDGRARAKDILEETRGRVSRLGFVPMVRAITCEPSPATVSYLKIKEARAEEAGMKLEVVRLEESATESEVIEAILRPGADAIIVQLPLPARMNTERIVNSIPASKDADVLSQEAYEAFEHGVPSALLPPVVAAVEVVLIHSNTEVAGKHVVVLGQGKLVGKPASVWLAKQGAQVSVVTREQGTSSLLSEAEIIISGAGSSGIITPELIKQGVILIDAGTSEQGGQLVGDADPACAEKASVFTPVPGGVGPIAVACLFRNVVTLLERSLQES